MKFLMRSGALGALVLALGSCGSPGDVDRVAGMETGGDAFTKALHAGYVELARKESGFRDWDDAMAFNDKAEAAGSGEAVLPDGLGNRDIDGDEQLAELVAERAALMGFLDGGARAERPELAARAQTMFDCWVEEAEEGPPNDGPIAAHQPEQLAMCREAYMAAAKDLARKPLVVVQKPRESVFTVYFDWNSTDLEFMATSQLRTVIVEAQMQQPSSITIEGHADRSGSEAYNMALSRMRAEAVAAFMAESGLDRAAMSLGWFGEDNPAVETDDGVREPDNRRVRISFE